MMADVGGIRMSAATGSPRHWRRPTRKHADEDAEHDAEDHHHDVERLQRYREAVKKIDEFFHPVDPAAASNFNLQIEPLFDRSLGKRDQKPALENGVTRDDGHAERDRQHG